MVRKKYSKVNFLFIGMVFQYFFSLAKSNIPTTIFKHSYSHIPGEYALYCDSSGLLEFDNIYNKLELFTIIPDSEKMTTKGHVYWLAFKIDNQSIYNLIIECVPSYEYIEFYWLSKQKEYTKEQYFRSTFIFNRSYVNNFSYFTVPNTQYENVFFLKIKSNVETGLGFDIGNSKYLLNKTATKTWYIGIFLGILFITIVYNLIFWLRLRDTAYFYYVGYLFSMFFFTLVFHELVGSLLGNLPYSYVFLTIPYIGMTIFLLFYSDKVLNMRQTMPSVHIIVLSCIGLRVLIFFVTIILKSPVHDPLIDNFLLLPAIYGAFLEIRKKNKSANFLMVSLLLIAIAYFIHTYLHKTDLEEKMPNWLKNGELFFMFSTLEIIFLSFTLSERFIQIKKEKENHQQGLIENQKELLRIAEENKLLQISYNSNLEKLVAQRTGELFEANEKLKHHANEIQRINNVLEEDNIKLSHDMEDINKARLMDEDLNFSEFQQFYPDEKFSLGFVASLKWNKGYECRKCGYKKYYDAKLPYSKICKVCGHFESATSKTLFENVKFPLQKALYIAYLVHVSKKVNVTHLSHQLDLRTATCYNFVKKVYATIEKLKRKPDDWISIIYLH